MVVLVVKFRYNISYDECFSLASLSCEEKKTAFVWIFDELLNKVLNFLFILGLSDQEFRLFLEILVIAVIHDIVQMRLQIRKRDQSCRLLEMDYGLEILSCYVFSFELLFSDKPKRHFLLRVTDQIRPDQNMFVSCFFSLAHEPRCQVYFVAQD